MSKIDTLVAELCPDGVEYKEIGDVLNYEQPTKYLVSSKDYSDDNATPVLTAGKTFILGYTSETDGIYPASRMNPVIIFDDFTTDFKWVDFPFKAKSSGMKMLTAADENLATIRYAYHAMQAISFSPLDHKRHWISEYSHFEIPVPPIEVQREIVRILDAFVALTDELTAKLAEEATARKAQYAYYRDRLLSQESLEAMDGRSVEMVKLGKTCLIESGRLNAKAATENGAYCFFTTAEEVSKIDTYRWDTEAILIAGNANVGSVKHFKGKFEAYQRTYVLTQFVSDIQPRYLYHYLEARLKEYLADKSNSAAMTYIVLSTLQGFPIPVPSLSTQRKVFDILDRFDALATSLTDGIPAEIEARKAQYGYYRDRLLDFPRKAIGTE